MSLNQSKAELQEAVKRLEKERKDHNKLQEQVGPLHDFLSSQT